MKRYLLVLILLLGVTGLVLAQDDGPAEDPDENACYTGGALEGKCDWPTDEEDEWAWECGWYYAGVVSGRLTSAPERCDILFVKADAPSVLPLCVEVDAAAGKTAAPAYVLLMNGPNQPGNAQLYYDVRDSSEVPAPCDELDPGKESAIWMQTVSYVEYEDALDMCGEADDSTSWSVAFQIDHPQLGGFNWVCIGFDK